MQAGFQYSKKENIVLDYVTINGYPSIELSKLILIKIRTETTLRSIK